MFAPRKSVAALNAPSDAAKSVQFSRDHRGRPNAPSAGRAAKEAIHDRIEKQKTQDLAHHEVHANSKQQSPEFRMLHAKAMLPADRLALPTPAELELFDQRIAELEACFTSSEIPHENEWRNLPRICTRHEIAEAKRLAKLINPKRWREIFINYCSALLALRSARPKQWAKRDDNLDGAWWYAPWFKLNSAHEISSLARGLKLGFENVIASEHLDRQKSILELDLSKRRVGDLTSPESLNQIFLEIGTRFNEGTLGYFTTNSENCPQEVYALLKLFLRRCSDKGIIFDCGSRFDTTDSKAAVTARMARGQIFAWHEAGRALKEAVKNESPALLRTTLRAFRDLPKNVPAYVQVDEADPAYSALSIFSAFMLPACPLISAEVSTAPNSQGANALKKMNALWQSRSAMRSRSTYVLKTNQEEVLAVVKSCASDEDGDILMLANFAGHESEVELALDPERIHSIQAINAGANSSQESKAISPSRAANGRAQVLVPPHGLIIGTIKRR